VEPFRRYASSRGGRAAGQPLRFDETWKALSEKYDDRQRLEVVLTVANYTMLAMYFNATGAQLPAGRSGFPID
jgi:hypothetical protein